MAAGYKELNMVAPLQNEDSMHSLKGRSMSKLDLLHSLMVRDNDELLWILQRLQTERAADIHLEVSEVARPVYNGTESRSPKRAFASTPGDHSHEQPVIQFARVEFHAEPSKDHVEIVLNRTGSKKGVSKVKYFTKDLTARVGIDYGKVEETAVFQAGQGSLKLRVPLLGADNWEALVDFEVKLDGDSVEGAVLARQLTSTKVKIIGVGAFPKTDLKGILEADSALVHHGNKITFFIAFLKLLWAQSKIRSGIIKRCFQGQLHNVNFIVMQFISVFTINVIFKDKGATEAIGPLTRKEWLLAIVGVQILSMFILHGVDYMKLGWSVGGPARKMIQKGILRRYMYFDSISRSEVRSTDLATAITRNSIGVVGGVGLCIGLCNVLGGIISILVFKLTAPIVFHSSSRISLLSFSPFAVYPIVLGTFISLRAPRTTVALDKVQDSRDDLLEYAYLAVECFPVLNDYRRRNKYVDDLDEWINAYNKANREKNQLVVNNTYLPHWLSTLFVAFWYIYFGEEVLSNALSLGFFLADLKIIDKFGKEFEQLYSILMSMESTFPDLQRVVVLLNKETDLDDRLQNELVVLEQTETLRAEYAKEGHGALDRVPLYANNLKFKIGKPFNFQGKVTAEQGQMVCFVGKHGHGKSMLLKVIGGGIFPSLEQGEVFIPSHLRVLHVPFDAIFLRKPFRDNMVLGCETTGDAEKERVIEILKRFKLHDYCDDLDDDDNDPRWMKVLTVKEASMINLARALVANPHVLCIHKPTLAKAANDAELVMRLLKEFVDNRGIAQPSDQPVSSRRPRTILYTSISPKSLKYADQIYQVSPNSVRQIPMESVTDDIFG